MLLYLGLSVAVLKTVRKSLDDLNKKKKLLGWWINYWPHRAMKYEKVYYLLS